MVSRILEERESHVAKNHESTPAIRTFLQWRVESSRASSPLVPHRLRHPRRRVSSAAELFLVEKATPQLRAGAGGVNRGHASPRKRGGGGSRERSGGASARPAAGPRPVRRRGLASAAAGARRVRRRGLGERCGGASASPTDLVSSASLSPFPSPLIFFPSLASDCFFELASTASEIREPMARAPQWRLR